MNEMRKDIGQKMSPKLNSHEKHLSSQELVKLHKVDIHYGEDHSDYDVRANQHTRAPIVQRIGTAMSVGLESFFYKLGLGIGKRPWTVILCTFLVAALCGIGMIRFEMKDSSEPIWVPPDSAVLRNQEWVEQHFPVKYRFNVYIITADNILTPDSLKQMLEIDRQVKELHEYNNTIDDAYNFNWTSVCVQLMGVCWSNSILELWNFNETAIKSLSSNNDITNHLKLTARSPVFHSMYNLEDWLGDISYDQDGRIIGAKAAKMLFVIKATSSDELNTRIVAPDLLWEKKFIELGKTLPSQLAGIKSVSIAAVRSFRDESDNSFDADVMLLTAGCGIIIAYVAIVLGKFNEVEHKVYLALIGVFGIGLSSLESYGLASALGMFYGPIHPILPFMLLGLGVDDMFVIIEAWNNLTTMQRKKELHIKIAITLKHAGVSITLTSVTDLVAFAIGSSTALPAMRSFCVYASLGILTLYITTATFFVACLTIDQRRQDASRDACCIWIKYSNFQPNHCSQRLFLPWFLRKFFTPFLITPPIKALIVTFSICILAVSGYGTYQLKTHSDLAWFLPADSYFTQYIKVHNQYFDDGILAHIYTGNISYYNEKRNLLAMMTELQESEFVKRDSLANWHDSFLKWLENAEAQGFVTHLNIKVNQEKYPASEEDFYKLLNIYVGQFGKQFYEGLKWNDTDPMRPRLLEASKIGFKVKSLKTSEREVAALEYFEALSKKYFPGKSFVWAVQLRNWETNRVIQRELYTNLALAFASVLFVTLLLVANVWVCVLVCLCVVVTLVNVCGFMHFWGLTIDTLTSILLILSIGLAVDYSAHIGHTFMTIHGTRNDRAKFTVSTIGPAVMHGGFSTFLAFVLLATSDSYVFMTFFKVFFLVVIFGLFNGVILLPVLLSLFGPAPHLNAKRVDFTSNVSVTAKDQTSVPLQSTCVPPSGAAPLSADIKLQTHSKIPSIPECDDKCNDNVIVLREENLSNLEKPLKAHWLPLQQDIPVTMGNELSANIRDSGIFFSAANTPSNKDQEIDELLTKLEKATQDCPEEHKAEVYLPSDHNEIIQNCTWYLEQNPTAEQQQQQQQQQQLVSQSLH